jgi:hypothetical protein
MQMKQSRGFCSVTPALLLLVLLLQEWTSLDASLLMQMVGHPLHRRRRLHQGSNKRQRKLHRMLLVVLGVEKQSLQGRRGGVSDQRGAWTEQMHVSYVP